MCTWGRVPNVYPGYMRHIEWTYYIVGKQRCVPGVFISTCIQGTRDILNGHSISLVNNDVYLGTSSQYVSRVHEIILNKHSILLVNSDVYLGSSSQCVSRVQELY